MRSILSLFFFTLLISPTSQASALGARQLVGRCSFDPTTEDPAKGSYNSGNVVANFYSVPDQTGTILVVVEGVTKAGGFITDKMDRNVQETAAGPASAVQPDALAFPGKLSWKSKDTNEIDLPIDCISEVGYSGNFGHVESYPSRGSCIQNRVLKRANAYPTCIFWN